jgi:hypothetical protein
VDKSFAGDDGMDAGERANVGMRRGCIEHDGHGCTGWV